VDYLTNASLNALDDLYKLMVRNRDQGKYEIIIRINSGVITGKFPRRVN
jgi:hypothetical protein